jgi:hypothetical protein
MLESICEGSPGRTIIRIGTQDTPKRSERAEDVSLLLTHETQVVESSLVVRMSLQEVLEYLFGVVMAPQPVLHGSQVQEGFFMARVGGYGRLEGDAGLVEIRFLKGLATEPMVSLRVIETTREVVRIQRQGPVHEFQSLSQRPGLCPSHTQEMKRLGILRVGSEDLPIEFLSLGQRTGLVAVDGLLEKGVGGRNGSEVLPRMDRHGRTPFAVKRAPPTRKSTRLPYAFVQEPGHSIGVAPLK